tara:strand:+ start:277 stop:429 length:153 start_codon:yes stop_codon:yes gene_type:complete
MLSGGMYVTNEFSQYLHLIILLFINGGGAQYAAGLVYLYCGGKQAAEGIL